MSDLMVANTTYTLGTNDTASTVANNITLIDAQHINGPASACVGIQTVLGLGTSLIGTKADLVARLAVSLASDGTLVLDDYLFEPGDICTSFRSSKTGWLLMDGTERSNTTYVNLFDQIITYISNASSSYAVRTGTATGNPTADAGTDTFTLAAHGLGNNTVVYFTNSGGGLPGGISVTTKYYIINTAANTFQVSTTSGGSAVNLTTAGTGTHSVYSTFICDARGVFPIGKDNMGGSSRNRTTDVAADGTGQGGGSEDAINVSHNHTATDAGHTHVLGGLSFTYNPNAGASTGTSVFQSGDVSVGNKNAGTTTTVTSTNSGTASITVNTNGSSGTSANLPPYMTVHYFIKT